MQNTRKSDTDRSLEQVLERLGKIEAKLELFDKRLVEIENSYVARDIQVDDKIKEIASDCGNKITSSELRYESRVEELGTKLQVVSDQTTAIEMRLGDLTKSSKDWPTIKEANLISERKNIEVNRKSVSFADKFKKKAKDTIVLIGDSLARGVGAKLEQQSHMVTTRSRGGAKIENITEQIGLLQQNEGRHLVVLVGTNNIQNENSETIKLKYRSLLETCKKVKNRRVSVIGIPQRFDLTDYQNSRRIGVNLQLEKLCKEFDIEFILHEPYRSRLAKDGLHFNYTGQDELARKIFDHCMNFLV